MSIFAMLGMDGQSLIVYHYISMLCIVVEKYFGIIKENSLIINLSNFLHRKIEIVIPGLTGDVRTTASYLYIKTSQRSTLDTATHGTCCFYMCRAQNASIRVLPLSKSQHIDAFCAQVVHGIAEYMYNS